MSVVAVMLPVCLVGHLVLGAVLLRLRGELVRARLAADRDDLTGLLSRHTAQRTHARWCAGGHRTTMVMIDLDRFKTVNDTYGHPAGDQLLAAVGGRLGEHVRRLGGVTARLGGDEFLLLLPATSPAVHGVQVARILDDLSAPVAVDGHCGPVLLRPAGTAGIAVGAAGDEWAALLRSADCTLYQARRVGARYRCAPRPFRRKLAAGQLVGDQCRLAGGTKRHPVGGRRGRDRGTSADGKPPSYPPTIGNSLEVQRVSIIGPPGPVVVVPPGQGRTEQFGSFGVVFKLWGPDTGGAVAMVEHPFAVGALVTPHRHTREDEYSIVLEGEIGFRSEDREAVLGPGGYITKPRGELHAMWNAGTTPARMIEIISPAGFEGFFRDVADLAAAGDPVYEEVAAVAAAYGLEFEEAPWLPDIIARYHLTE